MGDVMVDFTFLEKEQVVGEKKLEILEKYGLVCTLTDFSILLGGCASFNYYLDNTAPSKVTRASWWWLKSTNDETVVHGGFEAFLKLLDKYKPRYWAYGHVHTRYGNMPRTLHRNETILVNACERYMIEI